MRHSVNNREAAAGFKAVLSCLSMGVVLVGLTITTAQATENAANVYPTGVETVMPGMTPPPGATMFEEFDTTYQANRLLGPTGQSLVPNFRLSVYAFAPKFVHNWGVHVLGGTLVSAGAVPLLNMRLQIPTGVSHKTGLGNPELGIAYVAYNMGSWHWWYGLDVYTPAWSAYHKTDALNIGQHYFSTAPVAAFTYLPNHSRTELSSRVQYIVNYDNHATNYHSGNEFTWEYDGMQNVTKKLAIGVNGYYYQQLTDDRLNGAIVANGNRGRAFDVGPEVRYHLGHLALIVKYQKDTMVQNRTRGNQFWFELGVPFGHSHTVRASAPAPAPVPVPAPVPSVASAGGAGGSR